MSIGEKKIGSPPWKGSRNGAMAVASRQLTVRLEVGPELGPGLARRAADVNVRMVFAFFVLDSVGISVVAGDPAGIEGAFDIAARETDDDQGFRRRISVAAEPGSVGAAEGLGQVVSRAVEIDGAGFSVVAGEDAEAFAFSWRQRIANLGYGSDEISETDFFAKVAVVAQREIIRGDMRIQGNDESDGEGAGDGERGKRHAPHGARPCR